MEQPNPMTKKTKTKYIQKAKRATFKDRKRQASQSLDQNDSNQCSQQDQPINHYPDFDIQKVRQQIQKMPTLYNILIKNQHEKFRDKILKRFLKPPTFSDGQGHIYGFMDLNKNGAFDHKHTIKIGRTSQRPHLRIDEQIRKDRIKYKEILAIYTMYNKKLQRLVHLFFNFARQKIEISGQTRIEWFRFQERIRQVQVISMINQVMQKIHQSMQMVKSYPTPQGDQPIKSKQKQQNKSQYKLQQEKIKIQKLIFQLPPQDILEQYHLKTLTKNQTIIFCLDSEAYKNIQTILQIDKFITKGQEGSQKSEKSNNSVKLIPLYFQVQSLLQKTSRKQILSFFVDNYIIWESQMHLYKLQSLYLFAITKTEKMEVQNPVLYQIAYERIPLIMLNKTKNKKQSKNLIILDQQQPQKEYQIANHPVKIFQLPEFSLLIQHQMLKIQKKFNEFIHKIRSNYVGKPVAKFSQMIRKPMRQFCSKIVQSSYLVFEFQQKLVDGIKELSKRLNQKQLRQSVVLRSRIEGILDELNEQQNSNRAYTMVCKFLDILRITDMQSTTVIKIYFFAVICANQGQDINPFSYLAQRLKQQLNNYFFQWLLQKLQLKFLLDFQTTLKSTIRRIRDSKQHDHYKKHALLFYKLIINTHEQCFVKITTQNELYQFLRTNQYVQQSGQFNDLLKIAKELVDLSDANIQLSDSIIYGTIKILQKLINQLKDDQVFFGQVVYHIR